MESMIFNGQRAGDRATLDHGGSIRATHLALPIITIRETQIGEHSARGQ
jgi:hypothetical protein